MTIKVRVPGRDDLVIENIVLDVNGTIALDGKLLAGVAERIGRLRQLARVVIVTADTHGEAVRLGEDLGLEVMVLDAGDGAPQKMQSLHRLGPDMTAAIGNGSNDVLMLERSALGICVTGQRRSFRGGASEGQHPGHRHLRRPRSPSEHPTRSRRPCGSEAYPGGARRPPGAGHPGAGRQGCLIGASAARSPAPAASGTSGTTPGRPGLLTITQSQKCTTRSMAEMTASIAAILPTVRT